ncbi:hypothetical protein CY34DRAFT_806959 [Suillus luteus UH-Slu-Lm8-n1]|uniref:Uncharacterized protein n=1 Tax=Suillus luteus UH-Slu-Lm8-n1 TaxID=930992 RepID=A0A0C9ZSD7_9AGAM|nr:hypothetical protein CY34DRAFT_806959 [Suillus luteus UH-Slu-Lm8-n1]
MALYLQSPTSVPATQRTGLYVDRAFITEPMNILKYHIMPYIDNNRDNIHKYGGGFDIEMCGLM